MLAKSFFIMSIILLCPLIHLFSKYLLCIYYMLGTVQVSWNTSVSKTGKDSCSLGIDILVGRGGYRQQANDTSDK